MKLKKKIMCSCNEFEATSYHWGPVCDRCWAIERRNGPHIAHAPDVKIRKEIKESTGSKVAWKRAFDAWLTGRGGTLGNTFEMQINHSG